MLVRKKIQPIKARVKRAKKRLYSKFETNARWGEVKLAVDYTYDCYSRLHDIFLNNGVLHGHSHKKLIIYPDRIRQMPTHALEMAIDLFKQISRAEQLIERHYRRAKKYGLKLPAGTYYSALMDEATGKFGFFEHKQRVQISRYNRAKETSIGIKPLVEELKRRQQKHR